MRLLPLTALIVSACLWQAAHAVKVKLAADGLVIDAGAAGVHTLKYPRLLTPGDKGLDPEHVTPKDDGSGVTMTYSPSGKLTIDRQPDGGWLFHFTEIPPDRVKFAFGIQFPLSVIEEGTLWSFDAQTPAPFPATKDKLSLYMGNPGKFVYQKDKAGFVITYPQKTWTVFSDQRVWGRKIFGLGQIFYFPGKKTVPEISYRFVIGDLPEAPALKSDPAK